MPWNPVHAAVCVARLSVAGLVVLALKDPTRRRWWILVVWQTRRCYSACQIAASVSLGVELRRDSWEQRGGNVGLPAFMASHDLQGLVPKWCLSLRMSNSNQ